jgi:hypothetical protein
MKRFLKSFLRTTGFALVVSALTLVALLCVEGFREPFCSPTASRVVAAQKALRGLAQSLRQDPYRSAKIAPPSSEPAMRFRARPAHETQREHRKLARSSAHSLHKSRKSRVARRKRHQPASKKLARRKRRRDTSRWALTKKHRAQKAAYQKPQVISFE